MMGSQKSMSAHGRGMSVPEVRIEISGNGLADPKQPFVFLATFNGRRLCYVPEECCVWLEGGPFKIVPNLEREVARYFKSMLLGTRI
jgi:hypothetical protein